MTGKLNIGLINATAPRSWAEFSEFFKHEFRDVHFLEGIDFENLPFEFQIGILIRYFQENNIDIEVCNQGFQELLDYIPIAFKIHEGVLNHYS